MVMTLKTVPMELMMKVKMFEISKKPKIRKKILFKNSITEGN